MGPPAGGGKQIPRLGGLMGSFRLWERWLSTNSCSISAGLDGRGGWGPPAGGEKQIPRLGLVMTIFRLWERWLSTNSCSISAGLDGKGRMGVLPLVAKSGSLAQG